MRYYSSCPLETVPFSPLSFRQRSPRSALEGEGSVGASEEGTVSRNGVGYHHSCLPLLEMSSLSTTGGKRERQIKAFTSAVCFQGAVFGSLSGNDFQ